MIMRTIKKVLYKMNVPNRLSKKRLRFIDRLYGGRLMNPRKSPVRILDIGCATGKDFVTFFKDRDDIEITGLDLQDYGLRQDNFKMVVGDAEHIAFHDSHFDLTVCIGVLEHIIPIEKLSRVIEEIDRVSKSYIVIVPSISTLTEPHIAQFLWQLRDRNKKSRYSGILIYMSDESWLAFRGFKKAKSLRFTHIPLFLNNLIIYKIENDAQQDAAL